MRILNKFLQVFNPVIRDLFEDVDLCAVYDL